LGTQWEHGGNHQNPNKTSNSPPPPNMQIILIPKMVPHHFWPRLEYAFLLGWGPGYPNGTYLFEVSMCMGNEMSGMLCELSSYTKF
jgi:hypothetical protein